MKPLVSIVVPVYNTPKCYLDKCLESLVSQSLTNIEIICVNDASTDDTLLYLHEWQHKDNRIKIIDSRVNKRQGGARNLGILAAQADYVGFVDSDDFVDTDMYRLLYQNSNDSDIVISNAYCNYTENASCITSQFNVDKNYDADDLKRLAVTRGCRIYTNIIKKKLIIENELFYPENCIYEDNANGPLIFLKAKIIKVIYDKPLYYYRTENFSTTRSMNNPYYFDRLLTANLMFSKSKTLGIYNVFKEEIDFAYYRLYFKNTIMGCVTKFSNPQVEKIREIARSFYDLNLNITHNKYFISHKTNADTFAIGMSKVPMLAYLIFYIRKAANWLKNEKYSHHTCSRR